MITELTTEPTTELTTELIPAGSITCPSCRQSVGITLDLPVPEQQYVEDCPVCCRPIAIRYSTDGGELIELRASAEYEA